MLNMSLLAQLVLQDLKLLCTFSKKGHNSVSKRKTEYENAILMVCPYIKAPAIVVLKKKFDPS